MEQLYHEEYWPIEVEWSRPREYDRLLDEGSTHDESANLYLISARYKNNTPKLLYIGQTFNQWVSKRLTQPDHKKRYDEFRHHYPNHTLYVSHGCVTVQGGGKLTSRRLDDIERILIYTNDRDHAHNIKNLYAHGVSDSYFIENKGSKCTLPRTISLGIFVKY